MTPTTLGQLIRKARKNIGLKQRDIALLANTGIRVISDMERGKATCQIGKILKVINVLGLEIDIHAK
jgi:HTH-type transcriptional regulator / antitoxin HipB